MPATATALPSVTPAPSSTLTTTKKTSAPKRARAAADRCGTETQVRATDAPARMSEEELDQRLDAQRAPARGYVLAHPGRAFTAEQVAAALGLPVDATDEALLEAAEEGEIDATIQRGTWRYAAPGTDLRLLRLQIEEAHIEARRAGAVPAGQSLRDFAVHVVGAPAAPAFGRRRGDLPRALDHIDGAACSLARHAFEESQRRGLLDRRFDFTAFLCDAVAERARFVTLGLMGISEEAGFDVRPVVDSSGAGVVRSLYFTCGMGR